MMGRHNRDQGQLFYSFCLNGVVPDDHHAREIDGVLDLSWVHAELAPHYSHLGRPSIDPVLMIRMLILGYVFAIRSERLPCREAQVNLAYCKGFAEPGGRARVAAGVAVACCSTWVSPAPVTAFLCANAYSYGPSCYVGPRLATVCLYVGKARPSGAASTAEVAA